jgi:hypothetical protein
VTFDPFGDFTTEGYLRNFEKEKDLAIVKRAENASFTTGLDEAFATLANPDERRCRNPRLQAGNYKCLIQAITRVKVKKRPVSASTKSSTIHHLNAYELRSFGMLTTARKRRHKRLTD